jgi:cytochrome P450
VKFPLSLSDPEFLGDRRESYRTLRQTAPVAPTILNGEATVVISRFRDAESLLRHPLGTVQPAANEFPKHLGSGPASVYYRLSAPGVDAPDHTRLRRVLSSSFSPQAVAGRKQWATQIVEDRLDDVAGAGVVDVVQRFGLTIPVDVACQLLDMPRTDADFLLQSIQDMSAIFSQGEMSSADLVRCDAAAQRYLDYFDRHLDISPQNTRESFTDNLLQGVAAGVLTREEAVCALIDVFIAGIHTTMVSITNAINAFALHPEQLAGLTMDEPTAVRAWEEVLRFDPPVHFRHRYVSEPITIDGQVIEPRVKIMIGLASANWDESVFENPDVFDLSRPTPRHLAFGGGGHFCLGMNLARLEGRLFLPRFIARFPRFQLVDTPRPRIEDLTFPHSSKLMVELS